METIIGALLTVSILSYVIGDNPLFRLATHILVGVGAAFAVGVVISQVIYPSLIVPLTNTSPEGRGQVLFGWFGVLGGVFMFAKLFRGASWLGNVAVGYIIGVGAGVAVGGALIGTLIPQTLGSVLSVDPRVVGLDGLLVNGLILISTLTVLVAFTYSRSPKRSAIGLFTSAGRTFLYIALGATFALVFIAGASALSALARDWFLRIFGG